MRWRARKYHVSLWLHREPIADLCSVWSIVWTAFDSCGHCWRIRILAFKQQRLGRYLHAWKTSKFVLPQCRWTPTIESFRSGFGWNGAQFRRWSRIDRLVTEIERCRSLSEHMRCDRWDSERRRESGRHHRSRRCETSLPSRYTSKNRFHSSIEPIILSLSMKMFFDDIWLKRSLNVVNGETTDKHSERIKRSLPWSSIWNLRIRPFIGRQRKHCINYRKTPWIAWPCISQGLFEYVYWITTDRLIVASLFLCPRSYWWKWLAHRTMFFKRMPRCVFLTFDD